MRKIFFLLLMTLCVLGLTGTSLAAGPAGWTAWFYNPETGHLMRVGVSNSEPTTYSTQDLDTSLFLRGGASPVNTRLLAMSISPESELVAYCTGGAFDDSLTPNPISLVIFDPWAMQIKQQVPLGEGALCSHSMQGWSADERYYAFGTMHRSVYQAEQNPVGPTWIIRVLDLTTGQFINQIPNSDPAFPNSSRYHYTLPQVNFFVPGQSIAATFQPFATEGPLFDAPALLMNYGGGSLTVQDSPLSGKFYSSVLGGAITWVDRDQAYPEVFYEGFGAPANVVKYSDKTGVQRVIYHTADSMIGSAIFIDNGERIAFSLHDTNFNPLGWRALNRNGSTTVLAIAGESLFNNLWGASITGTPLGYLYLRTEGAPQSRIFVGNGSGAAETLLWSDSSQSWRFIGSEPLTGSGFAEFPVINAPQQPPQNTACPLPTRLTGLSTARITPGPANNLRAQPTLSAQQLGQIPGSGAVALISGPVCADGMQWWQVNYNGLIGWTSEGDANGYWMEPNN